MEKRIEQPILISIVTANSQKIFQTLDTLIASLEDQPNIEILIFDNCSMPDYQEKSKFISMQKIKDLGMVTIITCYQANLLMQSFLIQMF